MNRSFTVTIFEYKNYLSLRFQRKFHSFAGQTSSIPARVQLPSHHSAVNHSAKTLFPPSPATELGLFSQT